MQKKKINTKTEMGQSEQEKTTTTTAFYPANSIS